MRIVAGTYRGRVLTTPRGRATRPTSDRVREAVFSILGAPPESANVLDLFAGSGAMAFEALSRGAAAATLVDNNTTALRCIRANAGALGVDSQVSVVGTDVGAFLRSSRAGSRAYAWVFIDPPYASTLATEALGALAAAPLVLAPGAVVVVEHDRRHRPPDEVESLLRTDERHYGDTHLSFFSAKPNP